VVLEKALEQIVCEAAYSVSVGKRHASYTSFRDALKKRDEAFALEINRRRAISEHDGGEPLESLGLLSGRAMRVEPLVFFLALAVGSVGFFLAVGFALFCTTRQYKLSDGFCIKISFTFFSCVGSNVCDSLPSGPSETCPPFDPDESLSLGRFEKNCKRSDCMNAMHNSLTTHQLVA